MAEGGAHLWGAGVAAAAGFGGQSVKKYDPQSQKMGRGHWGR